MARELASERPELPIALLAVNGDSFASGLSRMAAVSDLPLLQDHREVLAWSLWGANLRDVIIAGRNNEFVGAYNLSKQDLGEQGNFDQLKSMLIDAAESSAP
jgi:hypothetical protein